MKVLLRDAQTGLYRDEGGSWVSASTSAMRFETLEAAARAALQCKDLDLTVVLKYEEPSCGLALNPDYCLPPSVWLSGSPAALRV